MRPHRNREDGWGTINSLQERLTQAPDPAERAASTNCAGTWLDGLRGSFEPEGRKPKAPRLLAGRLRSA